MTRRANPDRNERRSSASWRSAARAMVTLAKLRLLVRLALYAALGVVLLAMSWYYG